MPGYVKRPDFIPLVPVPIKAASQFSRPFLSLSDSLEASFPSLKMDLVQSKLAFSPREYLSIALFSSMFYAALVAFVIFAVVLFSLKGGLAGANFKTLNIATGTLAAVGVGALIGVMTFMRMSLYPKIVARKRMRKLEQSLIEALRAMLIHIKSGVPLFYAFERIASGRYGVVSEEFTDATHRINTGKPEEEALQEVAMNSSSSFFRKTLWQLINGLKAGADLSSVLSDTVRTMTMEQRLQIQRFGSSLRMMSLVYMLLGVIIPTLGVTFLIVLSSFAKISVQDSTFWGLLTVLIVADFMFLGLLKSQRPSLLAEE